MAKGGYKLFCLFLILSALADCALGQNGPGTILFNNFADYDISFLNAVVFANGQTKVDPGFTPLPTGSSWSMTVPDNTETVNTQFRMTTNTPTPETQILVVWSTLPRAGACIDCWWDIDDQGFSVGASKDGPTTFVAGWE